MAQCRLTCFGHPLHSILSCRNPERRARIGGGLPHRLGHVTRMGNRAAILTDLAIMPSIIGL
jgi:hypothetical protein